MKTKISRTLSCVLGFLAVLCFTLAFSFNTQKPSVDATELISSDIQSEYHVGDELVMPATVTISVGDNQTVDGTDGVLVFPDGTVHNSASYIFEKEGEYQAIYYGTFGGDSVKATKTFKVLAQNWVLSSSKSDIKYMDKMPLNQKAGVRVSLAEGDAFVFDQRVNVYDLIAQQGDTFSVIKYTPEYWREGEDKNACQTISVKLVDYYDPDNFIEFYQWASSQTVPYTLEGKSKSGDQLYAGAGASHQSLTGLEHGSYMKPSNITDKFDGYEGKLYRPSRYKQSSVYGCAYGSISSYVYSPSNYTGTPKTSARSQVEFRFNMFTGHTFGASNFLTSVKSEYVYPGNLWEGFTTGEVYVQVQCFNYCYGKPVDLEITSILGITGADLNKAYVTDTVDPVIEFDAEYTDNSGIYIEKDVPFTIPTATVYDINYEGDLDVAVYYNYSSENPISVYLKDNVFTPTSYGRYTAVYTATDKFGNQTVATYDMNAIGTSQFTYDETKLPELSAATENFIPTINAIGINKAIDTKVYVIDPNGNAKDVTSTMVYSPEYTGNYKIRYVFTDNATSGTFEYNVESKDNGYVLYRDGFKSSNYLIKDATYDLEEYYVYKATANGLVPVLATIQASVDGQEFANVTNLDAYKVQGSNSVAFKAISGTNEKIVADCKIVDVGYTADAKDYTKFFQGADSAELGKNDIKYNFLAGTEVKKVDFINPVLLPNFIFDVTVPTGATYNEYRVTLSEFGTPENKIVIRYTTIVRGVETLLVIQFIGANGEVLQNKEVAGKFDMKHSINVSDGKFNTDAVSYDIPKFNDHRVMVSVEVISNEDASISFSKMGNQNLNNTITRSREAKPQIYLERVYSDYVLGATVDVPRVYALSVLSPVLEKDVTVSVTNNEGTEYVSNDNGQMKDLPANQSYTFNLSYLGTFRVTYSASASVGKNTVRSEQLFFVVDCQDSVAPEIQFEEGITERTLITFKAGRTHKLKTFTVSDNETAVEELFVRVTIFNEYHSTIAYDAMSDKTYNGEYTFEVPGNYYVQVYCQDTAGNYATTFYNICVLED